MADYEKTPATVPRAPRTTEAATKEVTIPACDKHLGRHKKTVCLRWECPVCGGPRGQVIRRHSYDGSRRMTCDGWDNPCGHVDKYRDVREEARRNGLNGPPRKSAEMPR
jgi:YD repeat-containing protein